MPVVTRNKFLLLSNSLEVDITHLAKGNYACSDQVRAFPLNRLILIIDNKSKTSFVRDAENFFALKPGSFIFIPSFHACEVCFDEDVTFLSIHFKMHIFLSADVFSGMHNIICEYAPELLEKGLALYNRPDSLKNAAELKSFVFAFAASKLGFVDVDAIHMASKYLKYRNVIDFVDNNCNAAIKVSTLAGIMHMGRENFTRAFKSDMAISPKEFLNQSLLHRASKLLLSDMRVKEVAYELSYSSEYYFSRFFKKHTGISPRKFQLLNSV